MEVKTKIIHGKSEALEEAFEIRQRVFTDEQGFPADIDVDEKDDQSLHVLIYVDEKPVATARMFSICEDVYQIGRVCVLKSYRKLHFGELLMNQLEKEAVKQHVKALIVHGQCQAEGFYKKCGYHAVGAPYLEDGCLHVTMKKEDFSND